VERGRSVLGEGEDQGPAEREDIRAGSEVILMIFGRSIPSLNLEPI